MKDDGGQDQGRGVLTRGYKEWLDSGHFTGKTDRVCYGRRNKVTERTQGIAKVFVLNNSERTSIYGEGQDFRRSRLGRRKVRSSVMDVLYI